MKPPVSGLVNDYLANLRAMGRRPATVAHYEYCLTQLETWRGQDISELTRLEARAWDLARAAPSA